MKSMTGLKVRTCNSMVAGLSLLGMANQGVVAPLRGMKEGNYPIP